MNIIVKEFERKKAQIEDIELLVKDAEDYEAFTTPDLGFYHRLIKHLKEILERENNED